MKDQELPVFITDVQVLRPFLMWCFEVALNKSIVLFKFLNEALIRIGAMLLYCTVQHGLVVCN